MKRYYKFYSYKCPNCARRYESRAWSTAHKCIDCGIKLVRATLEDKRFMRAKLELSQIEMENQNG